MKKLSIELFLKPFSFSRSKSLYNSNFFFASIKKANDSKQPQIKKDEITIDSKLVKSSNDLKNQQKLDLKQQNTQKRSIMTEEQKNKLMLQQKLQATYQELESLPSDSYETVVENFKKIKNKLMNRRVYIPNKPEIMVKMDRNLELVKNHHKIWRAPTTSSQRLLSDINKQIIEWELQQAKKKYYLSLLENEKILIGCALFVIFTFGGFEYFFFIKEEDKVEELPKMFI